MWGRLRRKGGRPLINHFYHKENKHGIGKDGWLERDNYRWRREYALSVMKMIGKKLDHMAADRKLLLKTEKYDAVHYMLNEWEALMNIFTRGDCRLDNNLTERLNQYISLSRRNSLFFGSHVGAKRSAMFYSLAGCKVLTFSPNNTSVNFYRSIVRGKMYVNRLNIYDKQQ